MRTELVHVLNHDEWNTVVQKAYALPRTYKVVADEEWANDSDHYFFDIQAGALSTPDSSDLAAFKAGNKPRYTMTYVILTDLVNRGVLEPGNYLIRVCW